MYDQEWVVWLTERQVNDEPGGHPNPRRRPVGAARRPTAVDAALAVWQHARAGYPLGNLKAEHRNLAGEEAWKRAVAANALLPGARS